MIAAVGSLITSNPAVGKDSQLRVLKPSTPWNLNYGTNSCRLARVFGSGDEQVAFYIEKYGISSDFTLLIAGKSISSVLDPSAKLRFSNGGGATNLTGGDFGTFGPSLFSTSATLNPATFAKQEDRAKLRRLMRSTYSKDAESLPDDEDLAPAALHQITWVELLRGKRTVRLMTGPWDATMAAMDKCVDDLVRTWGVDPAELKSIKSGPTPSDNFRISVVRRIIDHYPHAAVSNHTEANLSARLTIDTKGHVEACELTDITDAKDFDDYPCEVFKKYGQFSPAVDANGNAVKSIYRTKILYRFG
ncbi:hypothetical protein GRI58_03760 [Porphyrobacter algicida]|uniref:TonB C-terminal domain-containing protein n=1 Tax=Qipengyuania algicida TaxID=1836209 RepID=A0A845AEM8_9SPHN|nr:hypothetical protein [Qipengyuania algicida]